MQTRKGMYNEYKHLWMLGRLYKNREEYNKLQKQLSTDWNKIKNEKETQGKAGVLGVTHHFYRLKFARSSFNALKVEI